MIEHFLQRLARNPFCCLLNENTCVGFALTGTRAETCPEHAAFVLIMFPQSTQISYVTETLLLLVTGAL